MPATLSPQSTKGWVPDGTPVYSRSLRVGRAGVNGDPNLTILAPSQTGGTTETVNAVAFWGNEAFTSTETKYQGDYLSDNSRQPAVTGTAYGITFFTFNRNQFVSKVNLNVGGNETGSTDFSDSIFVGASPKNSANNGPGVFTTKNMTFNQNTITTATADNLVGDLVVLGSDRAKGNDSYTMRYASGNSPTISGFIAGTRTAVPTLTMDGNTITTGGGNDSIIFANPLSVLSRNTINANGGADLIYFADASDVKLGNVINLGLNDNQADSLIFGFNTDFSTTGLGAGAMLTVNNFGTGDRFIYKGISYTTAASANAAMATANLSGRIVFNV